MNRRFKIDFDWLYREQGSEIESATFAELCIEAGGQVVTEIEDTLAKTLRGRMRGSAFLLARWFALNWWRLTCEAKGDSIAWEMAHRLGSVGGGYLWPDLTLISDGQSMLYSCRRSRSSVDGPIRYLASFDEVSSIMDFELAVDGFVEAVLSRLEGVHGEADQLNSLWTDVKRERADADQSEWRRREAMLGQDPDEAPEELMNALADHAGRFGSATVDEFASAFGLDSDAQLQLLSGSVRASAEGFQVPQVGVVRAAMRERSTDGLLPWQRAEQAAAIARQQWARPDGPLSDKFLSEMLGLRDDYFEKPGSGPAAVIPVAYRDGDDEHVQASVPKKRRTSRRFALARLVGDHLSAGSGDSLLAATDSRTARQKFQRAFGQEFLCPYADLHSLLGANPTEDAMEEAAERFGVSPLLVKTTLVNRGVLDRQVMSFE